MRLFKWGILVFLAMVHFVGAGVAYGNQHDRLIPLLSELEGWQSQPVQGSSLVSAQMKMISARRVYNQGEKELVVNLIVNSGPVLESDLKESRIEDEKNIIVSTLLDGFWVKTTYNKKLKSGQCVVCLAYNKESNSNLFVTYSKMDDTEALLNIQKFNWIEMKRVVTPML